nr:N-acetylmuramoyl-L-alanine amidase [uncultured Anaerocolumna sp.]
MRINIDAGHGTNTAGKRTPPMPETIKVNDKITIKKGEQFREHIASVGVAYYLEKELLRCGFDTMRTGWDDDNPYDDEDTGLSARQTAIAKADCDYSISIHFNAYGDGNSFNSAEGIGIYIHNKYAGQSKKLADIVLKHLVQGSYQKDRGVSPASLAMCNCNNMDVKGAILIELAFMTNKREAVELMANEAYWKESAIEIAKGLCEYTGIKYVPEKDQYVPAAPINQMSDIKAIKWLQEKLNKANPTYTIPVDGKYGPKTRIAVLMYAESKGWDWSKNTGYSSGKGTISSLKKIK